MSFISAAREKKRVWLAMALACVNVWRPERPKPVQGTKGDSACAPGIER